MVKFVGYWRCNFRCLLVPSFFDQAYFICLTVLLDFKFVPSITLKGLLGFVAIFPCEVASSAQKTSPYFILVFSI